MYLLCQQAPFANKKQFHFNIFLSYKKCKISNKTENFPICLFTFAMFIDICCFALKEESLSIYEFKIKYETENNNI